MTQCSARLQEAARAEADRAGREVDELQAEAADLRRQLEVLQGQVKDMQVGVPHGAALLRGSLLLARCQATHSIEQPAAEACQVRRRGACMGSAPDAWSVCSCMLLLNALQHREASADLKRHPPSAFAV